MQVYKNIHDLLSDTASVVTMGTFDGVHRGHQEIVRTVRSIAQEKNLRSVLITFDPHPREVLGNNGQQLFLLTTIQERTSLLEPLGIDACVVIPFTRTFSLLSAEEFFEEIIVARTNAKHIVIGYDHKFGKGRGGDATALQRIAAAKGIDVTIVSALMSGSQHISSTTIRKALYDGDLATATDCLGRPFSVHGIILRGEGLGKRIGFPTANVHVESLRKIFPRHGVYISRMKCQKEIFHGVVNVGVKPTVTEGKEVSIEMFLLDFDRDIYGANVEVEFLSRLRNEVNFDSIDALIGQIHADANAARDYFGAHTEQTINV